MRLPEAFQKEMRVILGDQYEQLIKSYNQERTYGIRINTLKISPEEFQKISPVELDPIPWCESGFYYSGDESLTRHPYYHAGLFYIQEPTAMTPAEWLNVSPGERVLDLCSAPGGKTVQIAGKMMGEGVLFANDINFNRLKAVIRNVEKYGIVNAVIFNNTQHEVLKVLEGRIDRLLIDAPCSGEGMFRKDEKMVTSYENDDLNRYPLIQESLLDKGVEMLKAGGTMVYSTCTFNQRENEEQLEQLIDQHSEITLDQMVRMMPYEVRGEGHFVSRLTKGGLESSEGIKSPCGNTPPESYLEFESLYLKIKNRGYFRTYKDKLYLSPVDEMDLKGLNVIRNGLYLGDLKKNRFEPSHALAMALKEDEAKHLINLKSDSPEVIKYLKGETIRCEGFPGYNLVAVEGYPLGWGKWQGGMLKNKYPPSYRIMK
jgi:NOL1/NOP2/sun family putative RNA methylase